MGEGNGMVFKVLLIDDEPGALEGMELWIPWEEIGFEVCGTCNNGSEGLSKLCELKPDLVITDVNMPVMSGLEMIKAWQEQGDSEISFVIVSGYSEFEYAQKALHYGVHHYLLKPLIAEEAEKELRQIHQELVRKTKRKHLDQLANYEETVTALKKLLMDHLLDGEEQAIIEELSILRERWNLCLVQIDSINLAELRERALSVVSTESSIFLIDIEPSCFAIIYGFNGVEYESDTWGKIEGISRYFKSHRVFIAVGLSQPLLTEIEQCYQTAKKAIKHKFYDYQYEGILLYQDIQAIEFSYSYDQIQLMDTILRTVELLDQDGFMQAVNRGKATFRNSLITPEIVKKIAVNIMYKIVEYTGPIKNISEEKMLEKYKLYEIADAVLNLDDLMDQLVACGMEVIDLLLQEQSRQAQGIVYEINTYIHEHFRENLTIKKLAEVFFLHPVYLGQLLIKKNGLSFNEMIHGLRIDEAAKLLQQHQYKNSEIAEMVGYSSYGQFTKQFERRMGMSPNQYKYSKF